MNGLLSGLLGISVLGAEIAVAAGLLTALVRVALGRDGAYTHLIGVGVAVLIIVLWQRGELGELVHSAARMLTTAARSQYLLLPWATPTPGR